MRMMRSVARLGLAVFSSVMLLCAEAGYCRAQEAPKSNASLAGYLPEGAIGTLEVSQLGPLIERIENSALLRLVLESPQWREAMKQESTQKALAGKAVAEAQLGMTLWQFAKVYLGDRVILGVYPPTLPGEQPDGVVILRVKEASSLVTLWDRLAPLLPLAGDKVQVSDHPGGGRLIKLEDGHQLVVRDRWIILSKVSNLLDQTLLSLANPSPTSAGLFASPAWKEMEAQLGTDHHVQLCVNLARLNELGGHRFIPAKLDNPLISLLFGGYIELAAGSPYLGSTLDIRENSFELKSTVAGNPDQFDAPHRPFVLANAPVPRAEVPPLKSPLNGFSLTRDFASWYRNREALLDAALLPNFDKFETGLATFLSGRDFGEDVLPTLGQRLTIVTAPQSYPQLKGKPGVQLPGLGLVLDLAKPSEANDLLNLVFQTVVLISNLQAAQEGRQSFVLSSESYRDTQISFAKYVKQPEGANLPIAYNFQPASARVGDRYIFTTSLELCHELVDSLKSAGDSRPVSQSEDKTPGVRDLYFDISPAVVADLLKLNESVLHAQSLQQGKSAEQADQELSTLLTLLRQLTPVTFMSTRHADRWVLELQGGWK